MVQDSFFRGVSGAFWGVTFAIIGLAILVASIGGEGLIRVFLAVVGVYSVVGIIYGSWAAKKAVMRSKVR
jgi:hypothetical protein